MSGRCSGWWLYDHNILCLLKGQVTFFVHTSFTAVETAIRRLSSLSGLQWSSRAALTQVCTAVQPALFILVDCCLSLHVQAPAIAQATWTPKGESYPRFCKKSLHAQVHLWLKTKSDCPQCKQTVHVRAASSPVFSIRPSDVPCVKYSTLTRECAWLKEWDKLGDFIFPSFVAWKRYKYSDAVNHLYRINSIRNYFILFWKV